jgi:transposase
MEHFAGLDVSMEETAVCVVDREGEVCLRTSVVTDPEAIAAALMPFARTLKRAGHEAGSLAPWLQDGLLAHGVPAVCLETRHVRAALGAQRNKTDATDALGLAHIVRTGWFKAAHTKDAATYRVRLLLTQRRNLKRKFLDLENTIRHSLKVFGVRLHKVGRGGFARAVRAACAGDALTAELMEIMLRAREALWSEYLKLHELVVRMAARSEVCRRFMRIPGVGPVTALSYLAAVEDPARFHRARNVAAYFGLTGRRWQSGASIDVRGGISKAGDPDVRRCLFAAAHILLTRYAGRSALKAWGLKLEKTKSHHKAAVAVARKLAVIMLAMWRDGTEYMAEAGAAPGGDPAAARRKDRALLGAYA